MTSSASVSGSTQVTVTEEDDSAVPDWWPLALLGVLLALALALGVWSWVRHSRRGRWDAELATTTAECRWVATTLTPGLVTRATPLTAVAAAWVEGQRRIDEASLGLSRLAPTAPTSERENQVAALSAALDALRQSLSADIALRTVTAADPAADLGLATSLQAVERARQALMSALGADPSLAQSAQS